MSAPRETEPVPLSNYESLVLGRLSRPRGMSLFWQLKAPAAAASLAKLADGSPSGLASAPPATD